MAGEALRGSKTNREDFPSDPAVKNLPCNAGYMALIPGQGT